MFLWVVCVYVCVLGSILICDLPDVVSMLQVLKARLLSHATLFEPVLMQVLQVCSQVRGGGEEGGGSG